MLDADADANGDAGDGDARRWSGRRRGDRLSRKARPAGTTLVLSASTRWRVRFGKDAPNPVVEKEVSCQSCAWWSRAGVAGKGTLPTNRHHWPTLPMKPNSFRSTEPIMRSLLSVDHRADVRQDLFVGQVGAKKLPKGENWRSERGRPVKV